MAGSAPKWSAWRLTPGTWIPCWKRRTGVVSSKVARTVRLGLRAVGLESDVDVLAGMDETARHKPHPDPLLYAARRLGAGPASSVDLKILERSRRGFAPRCIPAPGR